MFAVVDDAIGFKRDIFSNDCRQDIMTSYYGIGDYGRQRDFLRNPTTS